MGLKENIQEIEDKVEQTSFAYEMLKDMKAQNKRLFIIILVILGLWFATIGYLVYVLNDIGVIEDSDTIEIQDVETIDNSHIKIGDDVWEKLN